jgi:hypothetical protein
LHLTINKSTTGTINQTACGAYTWNGTTYTNSGKYSKLFIGGNSKGCDSTAILNLIINPIVVPQFNSLNGITGTWSPALNNTATTTYTFTPTAGSCASPTNLTLTVNPVPVITSTSKANICNGGTVNISLKSNVPSIYNWVAIDNPSTTGESTTPQTSSVISNTIFNNSTVAKTVTYNVTATSLFTDCPTATQTISVLVNPAVRAFAGNDTNAVMNVPLQLTASGGVSYSWSPAGPLNNPSIYNPLAVLKNDTKFIVQVADNLGCKATDTILVKVYQESTFYVPTAFSPNGDGLNDVFRPIPVGIVTFEWFRVYNRWGNWFLKAMNG